MAACHRSITAIHLNWPFLRQVPGIYLILLELLSGRRVGGRCSFAMRAYCLSEIDIVCCHIASKA